MTTITVKQLSFFSVCASVVMLTGCFSSPSVKEWDVVTINYTVLSLSGDILESSSGTAGKVITVWQPNTFMPIVHKEIIGMKKWDTKTLTITPQQWYGQLYDGNKIHRLPLSVLKNAWLNPVVWWIQDLWGPKGIVKKIEWTGDAAQVVVDLNPQQTRSNVSLSFTVVSL